KIRNPKSEIRNPKQIPMNKEQVLKTKAAAGGLIGGPLAICHLNFVLVSDSDFGFVLAGTGPAEKMWDMQASLRFQIGSGSVRYYSRSHAIPNGNLFKFDIRGVAGHRGWPADCGSRCSEAGDADTGKGRHLPN